MIISSNNIRYSKKKMIDRLSNGITARVSPVRHGGMLLSVMIFFLNSPIIVPAIFPFFLS